MMRVCMYTQLYDIRLRIHEYITEYARVYGPSNISTHIHTHNVQEQSGIVLDSVKMKLRAARNRRTKPSDSERSR